MMNNDDGSTLAQTIGRIMERLRRHHPRQPCTQSSCAKAIGVKQQMWSKWESGQNIPSTEYQLRVADFFGITLDVLCGRDTAPRAASPDKADASPGAGSVPVIGLAACDIAGWYNPGPLAVRAPLPPDCADAQRLFAVIAVGNSMVPDGIRAGYLLYCDPGAPPDPGDAVFVKTTDGKAAIKRYIRRDSDWITLQGWLDPDKTGAQRPYTNQSPPSLVSVLAPVILVRRRA